MYEEDLIQAIMASQDCDEDEANVIIQDLAYQVRHGANPEELLYHIGLEPDYVMILLDFVD